MKVQFVDVSFPEHYIRFKVDKKRVEDFVRIAAGLSPDQEIPKKPKLVNWPFPAIEVTKIEAKAGESLTSVKEVAKKGSKAKVKKFRPYELIDGRHRMTALARLGVHESDAKVANIIEPADRFMQQYHTNANGPLALDPYAKAQAIWTMVNIYKMKQAIVVKATNMTKASISRISGKKQGWEKHGGARPGAGRKKEGENNDASQKEMEETGSIFTPNQFLDRLQIMATEYKKIRAEVLSAISENLNHNELEVLVVSLGLLTGDLNTVLVPKEKDSS